MPTNPGFWPTKLSWPQGCDDVVDADYTQGQLPGYPLTQSIDSTLTHREGLSREVVGQSIWAMRLLITHHDFYPPIGTIIIKAAVIRRDASKLRWEAYQEHPQRRESPIPRFSQLGYPSIQQGEIHRKNTIQTVWQFRVSDFGIFPEEAVPEIYSGQWSN